MRRLVLICAALASIVLPVRADAQRAADLLTAGTRVRVTAPPAERRTASVVGYSASALTVTLGESAAGQIATSAISQLEVSRGKGRLTWGLGGALVGGILGGIIGGKQGGNDDLSGIGASAGFAAGFVQGAIIGGIAGAVFAPERWQDITSLLKSAP